MHFFAFSRAANCVRASGLLCLVFCIAASTKPPPPPTSSGPPPLPPTSPQPSAPPPLPSEGSGVPPPLPPTSSDATSSSGPPPLPGQEPTEKPTNNKTKPVSDGLIHISLGASKKASTSSENSTTASRTSSTQKKRSRSPIVIDDEQTRYASLCLTLSSHINFTSSLTCVRTDRAYSTLFFGIV